MHWSQQVADAKQKALDDMRAKADARKHRLAMVTDGSESDESTRKFEKSNTSDVVIDDAAESLASVLGGLNLKPKGIGVGLTDVADLCDSTEGEDESDEYEGEDNADDDGSSCNSVQDDSPPKAASLFKTVEGKTAASKAEDDWIMTIRSDRFHIKGSLKTMLYPHQVVAVDWMWNLWSLRKGCILADDMGLGKTITCSTVLAGLLKGKSIRRALIVAPLTLQSQWLKELKVVGLKYQAKEYSGSKNARAAALHEIQQCGGVLLTTYGMVANNFELLNTRPRRTDFELDDDKDLPFWDIAILDEGHTIKNPLTKNYKSLMSIPNNMRIIITGTPMQNNLMELHALYDYCCPGLLGDRKTFKSTVAKKIEESHVKSASQRVANEGAALAAKFRNVTKPYYLRRLKKDVFPEQVTTPDADTDASASPSMPTKNEFIVWLGMHKLQHTVYEAFLLSEPVKAALNDTKSCLAAISVLKKVCDHPALLNANAAQQMAAAGTKAAGKAKLQVQTGLILDSSSDESGSDCEEIARHPHEAAPEQLLKDWSDAGAGKRVLDSLQNQSVMDSSKTVFIMELLTLLIRQGHRTLIFSQSRVMLDILQSELKGRQIRMLRVDGSVSGSGVRHSLVAEFQSDPDIPVFLLSSKVGGLGLTITAADRVIIVDPAWNPATDNQSVDRAYRIGQTRPVIVYRLITCGTVEEKIYRRQVFKAGLAKASMEESNPTKYFSDSDLRDLFQCDVEELAKSITAIELRAQHGARKEYDESVTSHLRTLCKMPFVQDTSDHTELFKNETKEKVEPAPGDGFSSQNHIHPSGSQERNWGTKGLWSGADSIASRIQSALTVKDTAKAPPSRESKLRAKILSLSKEIKSLEATVQRTSVVLPDSGARLIASVSEKTLELSRLQSELKTLEGGPAPSAVESGTESRWGSSWGGVDSTSNNPRRESQAAAGVGTDDLADIMGRMSVRPAVNAVDTLCPPATSAPRSNVPATLAPPAVAVAVTRKSEDSFVSASSGSALVNGSGQKGSVSSAAITESEAQQQAVLTDVVNVRSSNTAPERAKAAPAQFVSGDTKAKTEVMKGESTTAAETAVKDLSPEALKQERKRLKAALNILQAAEKDSSQRKQYREMFARYQEVKAAA